MVYQLVYLSFLNPEFGTEVIDEILAKSRVNNPKIDVTGVLLYKGGIFLQVLEGPKENVITLYERIKKDQRHKEVKNLIELDNQARMFGDWSMAYEAVEKLDLNMVNLILPWPKLIQSAREGKRINQKLVLKLLEEFKSQLAAA